MKYIILYFLFFVVIYVANSIRAHSFSILRTTSFFAIYCAFTVLCSLVFYMLVNGIVRNYSAISLPPFIYLAFCYLISFIPFYIFDNSNNTLVVSKREREILHIVSVVLAICSVLPFIETVIHVPQVWLESETAGKMYELRSEGESSNLNYLSFVGRKFFYIIMLADPIIPCLIFYQLWIKKRNIYIIMGLVMCMLTVWGHAMSLGGRSTMLQSGMHLFVVFLIFRKFISNKIKIEISRKGIFVMVGLIVTFLTVSMSRYQSFGGSIFANNVFEWMSLYAGEGPLNFNNDMWYVTKNSGGYKTIPLILSVINGHMVSTAEIWAAGDSVGLPGNIYYTWIGGIYSDWGRYMTIIIIVLLSCFFCYVIRAKGKLITVSSLMIFSLWGKVLIVGPMFFTLGGTQRQINIVIMMILCIYLESNFNSSIEEMYKKLKEKRRLYKYN